MDKKTYTLEGPMGEWRVGQRVVKVLHCRDNYREASLAHVAEIKNGVIFVHAEGYESMDTGITYDANGEEIENFFPGFHAQITPLEE